MKRLYLLVLILILFLTNQNVSAQNYVAEYSCNSYEWAGKLYFNSKEWLYDVSYKAVIEVKISGVIMEEELGKGDSDGKMVNKFYYRSLIKNESMDSEFAGLSSSIPVKDVLKQPEWTINFDSTQIIGEYTCHFAEGIVRGRNYNIWFTTDIPVPAGPWKLWGLPGLIIKAESDDGLYKWSLTALKPSESPLKKPNVKKTISPEKYRSEIKEEALKLSRKIRSLAGNDIEIQSSVTITNPDKELFNQETY